MVKQKNFGIGAIVKIYNRKLLFKGAKLPLIITAIILLIFIVFGQVSKSILISVVDLTLTVIPSLLGFVLSGYALLIGFGNIEMIAKKQKGKNEESLKKPTLYQKVSTVFAMSLIMQIFLLVFAFGLKLILNVNLSCLFDSFWICNLVNYFLLTLMTFWLLYVTVMIKDLVINIFNFSQVQHFFINKQIKADNNERKMNKTNVHSN